ncbi:MAG: tetratricopeptide repeat protein, partial [Phycisphaerales bacterium]|nr:tetratricopeptide repeat protein [Phycisphaerales bacterium]
MRTGRVNIRFLLLLTAIIIGVVGIGGFLFALNYMNDAGRNIVQGDTYFEKGELRKALDYYGRAINKDPGNGEYLKKLEKTLLMIQPETLSEANELYGMYIGILRRGPDQEPRDADGHLRLLAELQKNARVIGEIDNWRTVERAAENMVSRVDPDSPKRWLGRAYLGFAQQRMAFTREEAQRAVEELMIVTENAPTIDLAWRGLIAAQLKVAIEVENAINTEAAEQYYVDADSSIRRALESVPDGPEIATIVAYRLSLDRDSEERMRVAAGRDLTTPYRVSNEELATAAQRIVTNLEGTTDMGQVIEAERILRRMGWVDGPNLGIQVIESYLKEVPDDDYIRLQLARLKYGVMSFDEAEELARQVLDAPRMTVGLLARIQPAIRQGAASLECDIAFRRWTGIDPDDTTLLAEHVATLREARDLLVSLTDNAEDDELVLKADAKLAYAEGNFTRCATLFDRLKRENTEGLKEAESYMILASALGKLGQTGSVMQNLQEAAARAPGNPTIAIEIARVLMRVKKYDDADRIIESILAQRPDFPAALAAKEASTRMRNRDAGIIVDPVNAVLAKAQELAKSGDLEAARAMLEASYNGDGRDAPLIITGYTLILMDMGRLDEARSVVSDGVSRFPDDKNLEALLVRLDTPDPVDSIVEYVTTVLKLEPLE